MDYVSQKKCDANTQEIRNELQIMNSKLDKIMPTIKEINNIRNAWDYGGVLGSFIVKFVIGIGVILTAAYAIKEWIKK